MIYLNTYKRLITSLIICFSVWSNAQECDDLGWEDNPLRTSRIAAQEDIIYTVPMNIIILRQDNGYTSLNEQEVWDAVDLYNANNAWVNIEVINVTRVDNSAYYNFNDEFGERAEVFELYGNYETLNTIFAGTVISPGSGNSVCGYAYYPSSNPENRVALVRNSCANSNNSSTTVHEFGHLISNLRHTHHNGNELVSGENCTFAGDDICDTGAEPVLGTGNVNTDCEYVGADSVTDDAGVPYNQAEVLGFLGPNPKNYMAYSRKICRTEFTTEQQERAQGAAAFYCQTMDCTTESLNPLPDCTTDLYDEVYKIKLTVNWGDVAGELYNLNGLSWSMLTPNGITLMGAVYGEDPVQSTGMSSEVYLLEDEDFDPDFPPFEDWGCFTFEISGDVPTLTYEISYNEGVSIHSGVVGESISFDIQNTTGLTENQTLGIPTYQKSKLKLTPNPFDNYIDISSKEDYKVYDLTGKLLIYGYGHKILTEELSDGLYFVRINNQVFKMVK